MEKHKHDTFIGAFVFWTPAESNQQGLADSLDAVGLSRFAPSPRTDHAALHAALTVYASGISKRNYPAIVQRHVKSEANGYEVVRVTRNENTNDYETVLCAKMLCGDVRVWHSSEYGLCLLLTQEVARQKQLVSGAEVGKALGEIAASLCGVQLKGMYWLPNRSRPEWEQAVRAVESAGETKTFLCESSPTTHTIVAIGRAVVEDISSKIDVIKEEMTEGLSERALQNRYDKLTELRQLTEQYEQILGVSLDQLRDKLSEVKRDETVAALCVI